MFNRLIKLLISTIYFISQKITSPIKFLFSKKYPSTLVVLSYHSVKPHQREKFANQMDKLLKAGTPVFPDILKDLNEGIHYIAVTFDDGFRNVLDNALPEMFARNIPATLFVVTGYLGKFPGWIKNNKHGNAREILMTSDDLKSLPYDLVKIGSHCVTHPKLTSLNKEQIIFELAESKKYLESLLERDIISLAFPYDNLNEEVVELARKVGYFHLFKDIPTYPMSKIDNFLLGRIDVSPDDWRIEYFLKLKGAYQWLPLAIRIKHFILNVFYAGRGRI